MAGIKVVATDLTESFRAGLSPGLDHARRVADPMLLLLSSGNTGPVGGEDPVDVSGDVALETPHGVTSRLAFADASFDVGAGGEVPAQPDQHDAPQRHV